MADHLAMIRKFHEAIGAPALDTPIVPPVDRIDLRITLLKEEYKEARAELGCAACGEPDLAKLAKELADVLVVTYGAALEFGIDLNAVFAEVHKSNMSKAEGMVKRADGKVLKGPNYQPPDIAKVLWAS